MIFTKAPVSLQSGGYFRSNPIFLRALAVFAVASFKPWIGKILSSCWYTPHYENVPFEVPEGWCWTTIGEVSSSILYGVSESAKNFGAFKLLRITDIQENKVDWNTVPYTDFDKDKALNYLLQDGDILFARTGATVGKSYLVSNLTEDSIYASYLIRVQTSHLILPEYIKRFFESGYYWEQISLSSVGIGQPNVNGTTLANLNIPIPPYKKQVRIVEEANSWLSIADYLDDNTGHIGKAIESARSKILDLAIHGVLVPQGISDSKHLGHFFGSVNPLDIFQDTCWIAEVLEECVFTI